MKIEYSAIIIDDEPKALELLANQIHELYNTFTIKASYTNWRNALTELRENDFDLLFLDMSMPQKSGMDLLDLVPGLKAEVIFITAHSEYALNAFNYSAAGYILKPVKEDVLIRTIDKALEKVHNRKLADQTTTLINSKSNKKLGIPNNRGVDYVDITDVIYFEAINRYTKVVMKDSEILSSYNIGKFKQLVEAQPFYQVHRSYIINLNHIARYDSSGVITMSNKTEIPIAKSIREEFLSIFDRVGK